MAIFCCGGSLRGRCLIRASSHGPGMGFSRFSVCGATLSLSARIVKAASIAPAARGRPCLAAVPLSLTMNLLHLTGRVQGFRVLLTRETNVQHTALCSLHMHEKSALLGGT